MGLEPTKFSLGNWPKIKNKNMHSMTLLFGDLQLPCFQRPTPKLPLMEYKWSTTDWSGRLWPAWSDGQCFKLNVVDCSSERT
jgi:hypothetical protein